MKFGPVPPNRLPQQDSSKVLMLAERWQRASWAHEKWATPAKEAVDFFEGRQYTDAQLAELKLQRRPALKFNIIAPIVRLVVGYHNANKTDITFSPAHDARSTDEVAQALTALEKAIVTDNLLEFVDPEVFLMGLISARGFFDTRLDWERNDLGEVKTVSLDPFTVKIDPDADTYDLNESASFVMIDRMVSIDEIEGNLGKRVAELVRPFTMGQTPLAPISSVVINDEIAPIRYFGQREDGDRGFWDQFFMLMGDFVDTHRKTIRLIEAQHKVREPRNVMIDLETGDKKVLPVEWGVDKIEKALLYAEMVGNPCVVERRMVERMQWTTQCGDLMLYDAPSYYDTYTMTGYFPYFRGGVTRGMVEDLIDPQREKNKSRSNRVEIESKTANGGWMHHESSLDPVQEQRLKKFGSTPGVTIKWKGEHRPERIDASPPPASYERLEASSDADLRRISGINEAALGDADARATSGRAILARQQQAVVSVQMYMDNFRRSKHLLGRQHLSLIQNYYTEQRIYRVTGEDGKKEPVIINEMVVDPISKAKRIINDVTIGKYAAVIDDRKGSPTFAQAQWEQTMELLEKLGPAMGNMLPMFADLILGMSDMPRKQEWIERFQALVGAGQPQPPGAAPPGQAAPPPGGAPQNAAALAPARLTPAESAMGM